MTLVVAHRGASAHLPEQTRAAYELALEQGADGVECDVRLTSDGHVVCFHDATVERTLPGVGAVAELSLAELRELGGGQLLTLAELVDLLRDAHRPVILAIELKHPNPFGLGLEAAVLAVLAEAGWEPASSTVDEVTVSLMSFNPLSVRALGINPRYVMILTSELTIDDIGSELGGRTADAAAVAELSAALAGGLQLIDGGIVGGAGPDVEFARAHPDRVRGWVASGLTVRVWTADDFADVDYLVGLGVQQITTNEPAAVRAHLEEVSGAQ